LFPPVEASEAWLNINGDLDIPFFGGFFSSGAFLSFLGILGVPVIGSGHY